MSSGLFTQLGAALESTYGTRVVPDHWGEFRSESFAGQQRFFQSMQLGAGTTAPKGSRFVPVTQDAPGGLVFEVPNKGYGFWLNLLHSATATPVQQGVTTAYKSTHPIGLTAPSRSATIQVGRPDTGGTVRPFDYYGCMVTQAEWSVNVDDALVNTLTFDGQKEDTAQTLATRSMPSGLSSFVFTQGTMTLAGSAVAHITNPSLSLPLPRDTSFYGLDATGLKQKPIMNAMMAGTGNAQARFIDLTTYNLYKNNTKPALILNFVGANIASTYYETVKFTVPMIGLTGATPNVTGPDVLSHPMPFNILYDGSSAPITIEYTSTDVTL